VAASGAIIPEGRVREFRAQQRRLLRAMLAIGRIHHKVAGMGSLELHILQLLNDQERQGEPSPISRDLAGELRVDKAALSRAVSTLVKRGFVKTEADARDGRRQVLLMTAKGLEMAREMDQRAQEANASMMEQVPPDLRPVMIEGLELYLGLIEKVLETNVWEADGELKAAELKQKRS